MRNAAPLEWITVARGCPYFVTESGEPWTPIGHNDAITWPTLAGLYRRRDLAAVEAYLRMLAGHGVTCLRLMLEYAQVRHRYFERPLGSYVPAMVRLWDDLLALCERYGLRVLLTPFDTFWTWRRWGWHPYNRKNGGYLDHPSKILLCTETRSAIKERLGFAVRRWGESGVIFAWDLWNEIHPAQAQDSADCFGDFIHDLSSYVRSLEQNLFGRARPQTVSLFGPEIYWRPHMPLKEPIFRHPDLDFASIHIYEEGTIDYPRDTVAPALGMGRIVAESIAEITDHRPFLDSEHGPIHSFKDHHITLAEPFDDEYFRHLQWAHLASGGAGGGMRWPNRKPHMLTAGMHEAQRGFSRFLPLIDWGRFRRVNIAKDIKLSSTAVAAFACADEDQAVVWLLRTDQIGPEGRVIESAEPLRVDVNIPMRKAGAYRVTLWNTKSGQQASVLFVQSDASNGLQLTLDLRNDLALAVRRIGT